MEVHDLREDFDEAVLARLHHDVFEPAFGPDELETVAVLAERLQGGLPPTFVLAALGPGGATLGGVAAERYPGGVLLITYLAVAPDARRHGVATALMREAAKRWYGPDVALVVAEVADDDGGRRMRFFSRMGAHRLDGHFVQPQLRPGAHRVHDFELLALHTSGAERSVPSSTVADWIRTYFAITEGEIRADDAELSTVLRQIESRDRLPLLPL